MARALTLALSLALLASLPGCRSCTPSWHDPPGGDGSGRGYTETRYPIVLIPGLYGFETLVGFVDYWPGVAEALESGGARVFTVSSIQVATSDARVAVLIPQLEEILAITGADRLNLVGHSQGSLDARQIAALRPDLVASVTAVGGPHLGSPIADLVEADGILGLGNLPEGGAELLADLLTLLGGPRGDNDGDAIAGLTAEHMAIYNTRFPAGIPSTYCGGGDPVVDGIRYYSWTGTGRLTNPADLLDPIWAISGLLISGANDGLVGRCSAHLGQVIRDDYLQNHIDETNLLLGLVSPLDADPRTLYRNQANRLRNAGL